jgi:protein TonB
MVTVHYAEFDRNRARLDWRAGLIVALVHVLMFAWLLRSPLGEPIRASLAPMVLVELWNGPLAERVPAVKPAAKPAAVKAAPNRAPKATAAAATSGSRLREPQVVVAEGNQALGAGAATPGVPASPSTIEGNADIGTSHGNGTRSLAHFHPPRVLQRTRPIYPLDAFEAGRQGSVDVMVTVAADGTPIEAHVYQSSGTPSLDAASVATIRTWKFKAAEKEGRPTEAQAIITLDWSIGPSTVVARDAPTFLEPSRNAANPRRVQGCLINNAGHPELCKS